ncbi:MAG: M23 family metallopeptidase [Coleofasciculaceae cyanobacterium]
MNNRWLTTFLVAFLWLAGSAIGAKANPNAENSCPQPILERLTKHKVVAGETLESIANQYNLIPATLLSLNPNLRGGAVSIGKEILVPPVNGILVRVPTGSSWKDVAQAYGVRADLLFELNGCQNQPQQVFLPGINWSAQGNAAADTYIGFAAYPLPSVAPTGLSYGWYHNSGSEQGIFHPGIDLLAEAGTPVLSVEVGTVAFASQQDVYGNLVVINHPGGRQTRYAHLNSLSVREGQQVQPGDALGVVGSTGAPDLEQPHLHFEVRYNSPLGWVAQDPELHFTNKPTAQR